MLVQSLSSPQRMKIEQSNGSVYRFLLHRKKERCIFIRTKRLKWKLCHSSIPWSQPTNCDLFRTFAKVMRPVLARAEIHLHPQWYGTYVWMWVVRCDLWTDRLTPPPSCLVTDYKLLVFIHGTRAWLEDACPWQLVTLIDWIFTSLMTKCLWDGVEAFLL